MRLCTPVSRSCLAERLGNDNPSARRERARGGGLDKRRAAAPPGLSGSSRSSDARGLCRCSSAPQPQEPEAGNRWAADPLTTVFHASSSLARRLKEVAGGGMFQSESYADGENQNWAEWEEIFEQTQEREKYLEALQGQIQAAVAAENYEEASVIKRAIDKCTKEDAVAVVVESLKEALASERYQEAALLRDQGGAGLVGWWLGQHSGRNRDTPSQEDVYGHIINVRAEQGRYVGRAYTARTLSDLQEVGTSEDSREFWAASGHPVLELFVRHDETGEGFRQQPVALQRVLTSSSSWNMYGSDLDEADFSITALQEQPHGHTAEDNAPLRDIPRYDIHMGEGLSHDEFLPVEGSVLVDFEQVIRRPATLEWEGRHAFLFEREESEEGKASREEEPFSANDEEQIAALEQVVSELTAEDLTARMDADADAKWKRVAQEVAKLEARLKQPMSALKAVKEAAEAMLEARDVDKGALVGLPTEDPGSVLRPLPSSTRFQRIYTSPPGADVFSGLYVGAFGPHGPELLQLKRGMWGSEHASEEYITAFKLSGDANVPSGMASFRARVGREHRIDHHGVYPQELGVLSCYKGEGRIAQEGFKDAQWVQGELLLLDGKGGMLTGNAELGFVWAVPGERRFLILFSRIHLPE